MTGNWPIDWEDLAWEHGFKGNYQGMLTHWHQVDHLTMVSMGDRLGVCASTVSKKMRELKIDITPIPYNNSRRGPRLPGRK